MGVALVGIECLESDCVFTELSFNLELDVLQSETHW
jgi:hypothetical protein